MPNLLKNFFSLGSVQVSGYLLTLVTMPYLIKTIGIEEFGVIVFSQTLVSYFIILIDYGFSITATKEISENRKNKGRINEIVSTVISIKIAIFTLGFLLYLLVLSIISPEEERLLIYIVTYFMGLSNVFFPVYYFQGVEKMHYTAIFNILPKVVVLCSVFVFVKSPADTLVVAIITSLGFAISGVTSLVYSIHLGVRYVKPSLQQCLLSVKDARSVFVGMLSSNISSNSIVLFLGIFTSSSIVGTYSAVEKFVKPVSFFSNTLLQVIYPRMVDMKKNNLNYMSFCLKLSVVYLILLTLALLVYYFALNYFFYYLVGNDALSQLVLNILIFLPLITSVLNSYFLPMLLVQDEKKIYATSLLYSCLSSLVILPIVIINFGLIGAAYMALAIEASKIVFIVILRKKYYVVS